MNKRFYSFANFFLGLSMAAALFQSIIYFQTGAQIYFLPSIAQWFLASSFISLPGILYLLAYYHHKQYTFTFWVMMVTILVSLYRGILFYHLLKTKELSGIYIVVTVIATVIEVVYAVSLVFSEAGKRPWLKAAGIFTGFLGLLTIGYLVWTLQQLGTQSMAEKIEQWLSFMGGLAPVLYIMNFRSEQAGIEGTHTYRQNSLSSFMDVVAVAAVVAGVFFGSKVVSESLWMVNNPDFVPEYLNKIVNPYEARTYANPEGDTLQYRLLLPLNYDSTRQYPLVVCLHGSSGRGTDNAKQVIAALPVQLLSTPENRAQYPAFLFVPQCPLNAAWGGMPRLPSVDSLVLETIRALEEEFPIDKSRCYVTGNSLGGYGTWHLIGTHPEMFAAAIPISGGGNPALAKNMVDVPIWAFHGEEDKNVPVSGSRDIIQAIKAAGGNPRYTEYPEKRHDIWQQVKDTPGLLDWLFAQQRN